jgi:antitoxin (DNA-binding transcriptional repressor) of toxin-antitoxin stability system
MKTLGKRELTERIDEILRLVKEQGETFEVTEQGEIVARLVPASESEQVVEDRDAAAWAKLKRIAAELEPYWPENVDAVEIVRDVRRDL